MSRPNCTCGVTVSVWACSQAKVSEAGGSGCEHDMLGGRDVQ